MTDTNPHPVELIMTQCSGAAPEPWYPSIFCQRTGISRDLLDPDLDRLRLGGLIQLTDWVQGNGQGYRLTPAGAEVAQNPRLMARLVAGQLSLPGERPRNTIQDGREFSDRLGHRADAAHKALTGEARPIITYALILINIAVFLYGLVLAHKEGVPRNDFLSESTPQILERTGAISGASIYFHHDWWRVLTCCFVHIGLLHLGVNMYSLYAVGPLLERMWGSVGFLVLYLIAGVAGSCFMVIGAPTGMGAGASGALWGVLASMATWIFANRKVLPPLLIAHWRRQLFFVFFMNVILTFSISSISAGAHFGGGLIGLVAALPLDHIRFGQRGRWVSVIALLLIPVVCFASMKHYLRNHEEYVSLGEGRHEIERMNQFLREMQPVEDGTTHLWPKVDSLLRKHYTRRKPDEVKTAIEGLNKNRDDLNLLVRHLVQSGHFVSPPALKAQMVAKERLEDWSKLLELASTCLQKGKDCTDAEETAIDEQFLQVKEIDSQWRKLLQP